MLRKIILSIVFAGLCLTGFSLIAQTEVIERRVVITTQVPAPKEAPVPAPTGPVYCFYVEAQWFNNVWVPRHQVCQYTGSTEGVVWVEGYWACNEYNSAGSCTMWDWKPAHWQKDYLVY